VIYINRDVRMSGLLTTGLTLPIRWQSLHHV